jgi:hypothetical protein
MTIEEKLNQKGFKGRKNMRHVLYGLESLRYQSGRTSVEEQLQNQCKIEEDPK